MTEQGNGDIVDPAIFAQMRASLAAVELPPLATGLSKADIDEEFAQLYADIRALRMEVRTERKRREERETHLRALIVANENLEEQRQQFEAEAASLREQIASGKSEPAVPPPDATPEQEAGRVAETPTRDGKPRVLKSGG